MRRNFPAVALVVSALSLASSACSLATTRMERALDPSMERVAGALVYLQTAAGISSNPQRMIRSDGYVYLSDIGPELRYMAVTGDSASYRALRRFAERDMVRREAAGAVPRRRYREGTPFEAASPFAALRFTEALTLGWQTFGDTASAILAAQMAPVAPLARELTVPRTETDQVAEQCVIAETTIASNPKAAAALLDRSRRYNGSREVPEESALGLRGSDATLVALACLTRVALELRDPDASVRHLDTMLDYLDPLMAHSGRPDLGVASDVLMALRKAQATGPKYK